jgi:hypothetical protein
MTAHNLYAELVQTQMEQLQDELGRFSTAMAVKGTPESMLRQRIQSLKDQGVLKRR